MREPFDLGRLIWGTIADPWFWPSGGLLLMSAALLAWPARRGLALHLLIGAAYGVILAALLEFNHAINHLGCSGPSNLGQVLYWLFVVPFLPLAAVALPIVWIARRSLSAVLPWPAAILGMSFLQAVGLTASTLVALCTPYGGLPRIGLLLELLE